MKELYAAMDRSSGKYGTSGTDDSYIDKAAKEVLLTKYKALAAGLAVEGRIK